VLAPRVAEKLVGRRKNWEKSWEKFHFPTNFLQLTSNKRRRTAIPRGAEKLVGRRKNQKKLGKNWKK